MRSNKKRIDARIPIWLRNALLEMAWKRGYNFTEMLQAAAEKGLTWYQKQWEKMHPNKNASPEPEDDANDGSRSISQNNYNKSEHDDYTKNPNYLKWCKDNKKDPKLRQNFNEYVNWRIENLD